MKTLASIINITFIISFIFMFLGNEDIGMWSKLGHGKRSHPRGLSLDVEGMLQVWPMKQDDRRYINVSDVVMHSQGNI